MKIEPLHRVAQKLNIDNKSYERNSLLMGSTKVTTGLGNNSIVKGNSGILRRSALQAIENKNTMMAWKKPEPANTNQKVKNSNLSFSMMKESPL